MLKYIIALVVFFAALEIFSIFVAAEFIGGLFALYVVIVEIFVGASIIKGYSSGLSGGFLGVAASGSKSGVMMLFGALIAFPGFFSDFIALLILIPVFRKLLRKLLVPVQAFVMSQMAKKMFANMTGSSQSNGTADDIFSNPLFKDMFAGQNTDTSSDELNESENADAEDVRVDVMSPSSGNKSAKRAAKVVDAEYTEL